jgi:hypothetical protein
MSDALWINAGKGTTVGTATIEADDELLTIAAHGLADGDTVTVDTLTGGAVGVLVADAVYFVRSALTNTFALSLSPAGPLVAFATDGGAAVYRWAPQYHAAELRRGLSGLLQRGDASGGFAARSGLFPDGSLVTGAAVASLAGTTWTVHDITGVVHTGITSATGPYLVAHPEESGSLDPADGTNDRIDALDLQIQDDDEDSSGFRRARVVYVTGTPAGSPVAPAVTANSLRIATVLVGSGGSPAPVLTVVVPYTVARGGIVPVRDSADYPAAGGLYHGMALYNIALQQLLIDSTGGGVWSPVASIKPPTRQTFTVAGSSTYTTPAGLRYALVRGYGGGGSGGGCAATGASTSAESGGGGGGEKREIWYTAAELGASAAVTVGAGGAAATAGDNAGNSGGVSTFNPAGTGITLTANGGGGGEGSLAGTTNHSQSGGTGGSGGAGGLGYPGSDGGMGRIVGGNVSSHANVGGASADGGTSVVPDANSAGTTGKFPGGGSSGGNSGNSQSARASLAGRAGAFIVDEYY